MDTLAHGLWGGMIGGWKRRFGVAFAFGVAPDVLSFGALMALRVIQGRFQPGKPEISTIPEWVHVSYNFTHSLIIIGAVWGLLWWWKRDLALPFIAWPLHILGDIPTHTHDFFPTPFLYPVSDFRVGGISWGEPWFMVLNYTCLALFSILWAVNRRRRRNEGIKHGKLKSTAQAKESVSSRSA